MSAEQQNNKQSSSQNKRQTKYRIPKKQLGFGSSHKRRSTHFDLNSGKLAAKQIPAYCYEQAYNLLEQHQTEIAKIINKTISQKHLRREVHEFHILDMLAGACSEYNSSKSNNFIGWIFFKLKCSLINHVKKEMLLQKGVEEEILAPILDSRLIYSIEQVLDADGDEVNKALAEILLQFVKRKCYAYEYEIYRLSYCEGLSDAEIANQKNIERSRITRIRGNVIKLIKYHKAEIEELFNKYLE